MTVSFLFLDCKIKIEYPPVYNQVKEAFESYDYEKVVNLLENAKLKKSQKTDLYYYYYGTALYKKSKRFTRDSIEYLKIATAFLPERADCYFYLGQMYFDIAEYEKSKENFLNARNLYENEKISDSKNVNLCIALTLCKMGIFNAADFETNFLPSESFYLEKFCESFLKNQVSEEFISELTEAERLELDEKLLMVDILLSRLPNAESICENVVRKNLDDTIMKFFYSKLIFYTLGNLESCEEILKKFCIHLGNDVYILDCNDFYVLQVFNKYLCFYYLKKGENKNAVNSFRAYKVDKYKILEQTTSVSEDLTPIFEEFKEDEEFKYLNKI